MQQEIERLYGHTRLHLDFGGNITEEELVTYLSAY
jgi:hypothetical protein